jgi:hypothetical protein
MMKPLPIQQAAKQCHDDPRSYRTLHPLSQPIIRLALGSFLNDHIASVKSDPDSSKCRLTL